MPGRRAGRTCGARMYVCDASQWKRYIKDKYRLRRLVSLFESLEKFLNVWGS